MDLSAAQPTRASFTAVSGLLAAFLLPAALLSGFSAATAAEAKECPQKVRWIMWSVKGVSCETGDRVAERAWDRASPVMTLGSSWTGSVGSWSCKAWVNEGGGGLMKCRKGAKLVVHRTLS